MISWKVPPTRNFVDYLTGGHMYASEKFLVSICGAILSPLVFFFLAANLPVITRLCLATMAFVDTTGFVYGVCANGQRELHRDGRVSMTTFHVIQIILEATSQLLLLDWLLVPSWPSTLTTAIVPFTTASVIALGWFTPLFLQRPLSLVLFFSSVVVSCTLVPVGSIPQQLWWLIPMILLKYLISMPVRAEPYSP